MSQGGGAGPSPELCLLSTVSVIMAFCKVHSPQKKSGEPLRWGGRAAQSCSGKAVYVGVEGQGEIGSLDRKSQAYAQQGDKKEERGLEEGEAVEAGGSDAGGDCRW